MFKIKTNIGAGAVAIQPSVGDNEQYTSKTVSPPLKKLFTQRFWKVYSINFRIIAIGTMTSLIHAGS